MSWRCHCSSPLEGQASRQAGRQAEENRQTPSHHESKQVMPLVLHFALLFIFIHPLKGEKWTLSDCFVMGGAGKVEKKGRKMPWRGHGRWGGSAAVRTLDYEMIVRYIDGPVYWVIPRFGLTNISFSFQTVVEEVFVSLTQITVAIPHSENTPLKVNVLHWKYYSYSTHKAEKRLLWVLYIYYWWILLLQLVEVELF